MSLKPLDAVGDDDHLEYHGDLAVVIPEGDAEALRGATVDWSDDLMRGGLMIDNPNTPSPAMGARPEADLSGPVPQRVMQVIDQQVNPAIAMHGGSAELVAVEDSTAYVRLGGGCVGCGMATVTLSQGIEVAITEAVPEIDNVIDVTDHASGTNPYYEAAKK
jgi:Fe/S biogenesis protein NfuA